MAFRALTIVCCFICRNNRPHSTMFVCTKALAIEGGYQMNCWLSKFNRSMDLLIDLQYIYFSVDGSGPEIRDINMSLCGCPELCLETTILTTFILNCFLWLSPHLQCLLCSSVWLVHNPRVSIFWKNCACTKLFVFMESLEQIFHWPWIKKGTRWAIEVYFWYCIALWLWCLACVCGLSRQGKDFRSSAQ